MVLNLNHISGLNGNRKKLWELGFVNVWKAYWCSGFYNCGLCELRNWQQLSLKWFWGLKLQYLVVNHWPFSWSKQPSLQIFALSSSRSSWTNATPILISNNHASTSLERFAIINTSHVEWNWWISIVIALFSECDSRSTRLRFRITVYFLVSPILIQHSTSLDE